MFGGSQVGKSYLIGALARGKAETLEIALGDSTHDFLEEINPGGGRESTGIVTRFSIKQPVHATPEFPVQVSLLTQMDIVKIFANSFFSDFHQNEEVVPSFDAIASVLTDARSKVQGAPIDNISSRDIDWLHAYMFERFRARPTVSVLENSGYWDELEKLAPFLSIEDLSLIHI